MQPLVKDIVVYNKKLDLVLLATDITIQSTYIGLHVEGSDLKLGQSYTMCFGPKDFKDLEVLGIL